MADFTRREFMKTGLAAGTLAVTGGLPLMAQRKTATDFVTLGRSGVKVTRLAFGTGSFSGQVQRDLGQEGFTRLVRHAYDRGIRFFETADTYGGMHEMLGIALKGAASRANSAISPRRGARRRLRRRSVGGRFEVRWKARKTSAGYRVTQIRAGSLCVRLGAPTARSCSWCLRRRSRTCPIAGSPFASSFAETYSRV